MDGAGLYVESAKGECNLGQHEIAFRYDEALTTCDNHSIYKTGAKEIAAQDGHGAHVHGQVRTSARATPATSTCRCAARDGGAGAGRRRRRTACRELGEHFLAGQLAALRELTLFYAPNINSYKRYAAGQLRPDRGRAGAWTTAPARCGWSGTGPSLRVENRVPGGDVNPYLAVAAMIAAGLHGIEQRAAARAAR